MATLDPKYSIGIPEMDAQHVRWIELIEEFRKVGSGHLLDQSGRDAALHTLQQLLEYTRSHFASEERFIETRGYPGLKEHRQAHQEIEAKVTELLREISAHETNTTPLKLNLFVTIWMMEHIMKEDDKYARFILGKK